MNRHEISLVPMLMRGNAEADINSHAGAWELGKAREGLEQSSDFVPLP